MRKVDGLIRVGEEKLHKFGKKGFQQFFEQSVVVDLIFIHRMDTPIWFSISSLHWKQKVGNPDFLRGRVVKYFLKYTR
ncbi:hypothetical protein HY02_05255 [Peptococcaceae bacterium SCADC1_2_3]|nr:hypothetical protein DK28_0202235 [Peptococcaceae bacterium SCADC1_2_3]KFI37572.1 hypothetical protein HY02_05255 [Peptococcaceae bacterium SCADC1_2_3]